MKNANGVKVVVTGGAGFIGSHLVDRLLEWGADVRVIDDLRFGKKENLPKNISLDQIDITDGNLDECFKDAEIVFHFVAISSVTKSVEDPIGTHDVNVVGLLKVLEAARGAGVKRIIFISSAAVYGSTPTMPTKESEPLAPESPYALHKIIGEEYSFLYERLFGIEAVVIRYFNVYGSRQRSDSPYSGVISIFMDKSKKGKVLTIEGDGEQTRDFIHVSDVVTATLLAATVPNLKREVFNIGTGVEVTINKLVETINTVMGNSAEPLHVDARIGDVRSSVADIAKAIRVLNWRPHVALKEGLEELKKEMKL